MPFARGGMERLALSGTGCHDLRVSPDRLLRQGALDAFVQRHFAGEGAGGFH